MIDQLQFYSRPKRDPADAGLYGTFFYFKQKKKFSGRKLLLRIYMVHASN